MSRPTGPPPEMKTSVLMQSDILISVRSKSALDMSLVVCLRLMRTEQNATTLLYPEYRVYRHTVCLKYPDLGHKSRLRAGMVNCCNTAVMYRFVSEESVPSVIKYF